MIIHDLVIGDFGRKGTLRYFAAFSEVERQHICRNFDIGEFYDEHRMIRYTVVGALRDIKSELLPDAYQGIDDNVLVGVEGGAQPVDILVPLVNILVPYVLNAVRLGANLVRIIIPCNTLHSVADKLSWIFDNADRLKFFARENDVLSDEANELIDHLNDIDVVSPSIPKVVVEELNEPEVDELRVIASKSAFKAYRSAAKNLDDAPTIYSHLPDGVENFGELLSHTVNGEKLPAIEPDSLEESTKYVSGCTDFVVPNSEDSARIFASRMVSDAYDLLEPDLY